MNNPNSYYLHTKKQAEIKNTILREKGLSQPHYSIQHIERYDLLYYKEKIYIPQSLRQATKNTMNTNFIRDRLEQNRISGLP
jgi:hypothetical protein